jgi:hypothetical protein
MKRGNTYPFICKINQFLNASYHQKLPSPIRLNLCHLSDYYYGGTHFFGGNLYH